MAVRSEIRLDIRYNNQAVDKRAIVLRMMQKAHKQIAVGGLMIHRANLSDIEVDGSLVTGFTNYTLDTEFLVYQVSANWRKLQFIVTVKYPGGTNLFQTVVGF